MWPDDLDLSAELATAGARARDSVAAHVRPGPAYAAALRSRLLAPLASPAAIPAVPRRRAGIRDILSVRRLAPMLAAAMLVVAMAAAASTVLIGNHPVPPPTPVPSLPVIVGPAGGGLLASDSPSPIESASATPTPSPTPSATATPQPTPVPTVTPAPTVKPTAVPIATPKPTLAPTPTPKPAIGTMVLALTGCNGGAVLEWSKVTDARFHHYVTLRSISSDIPASYPASGGAVEVAGTFSKDPATTSAVDASAPTGVSLSYRTLALDAGNAVIAASPVRSAIAKPVAALGTLSAAPAGDGKTTFAWAPYGGPGACFTYYKLVHSETDTTPSYLEGSAAWAAIGDQATTSVTLTGPVSGTTYHVRLQAVRATSLGAMVVAQTDVLTYPAP